jgi:hypothetical protein
MNLFKTYIICFLSLIISLALMLWGFFAVFQTKKLINFHMSTLTRNKSSNFEFLKRMSEKKWYYFNIKICGVIAVLMAFLLIFVIIHAIINAK